MAMDISNNGKRQDLREFKNLSWADVLKAFFEHLGAEGKQRQTRNFKTAFNQFLEAIGLKEESLVGTELGEEFEAKLKVFVDFEVSRKLCSSTYGPRVSQIRALKMFVAANFSTELQLQNLPKAFGQRLLHLITALGHTVRSFWRCLPEGLISRATLHGWCRERHLPSAKRVRLIETIESYLEVPPGTLRLPRYRLISCNLKAGSSDNSRKIRAALSKPYFVWTESLEEEFQSLQKHKTIAILPEGEERDERGNWTVSEDGGVPTAEYVKNVFRSFMGFCALPADNPDPYLRGAGIAPEALSLALLADKGLVESYRDFMRLRSGLRVRPVEDSDADEDKPPYMITAGGRWIFYDKGGKYNNGTITVLGIISGLLRPGKGYLYQHSEFASKLGPRMTAATWQQQCKRTRTRVNKIRKDVLKLQKEVNTDEFDFGRNPTEAIGWILELKRPLEILHQMLREMLEDLLPESDPKIDRARQFRNIVLIALLISNPLRIRMFSIMQFGKHLSRRGDGSWWLTFGRRAFKNRRSLKCDYEVRVAPELWPLIDHYKNAFHPILAGLSGSNYVFIGAGIGRHRDRSDKSLNQTTLSEIVRHITEVYLTGDMGFGPHAFRHIVATDIIKKDQGFGFILAARALHDKLETVEIQYIHLKTSEYFEPVNTHFSEMWGQVFGASPIALGTQPIVMEAAA
jgi:hypothetical protein